MKKLYFVGAISKSQEVKVFGMRYDLQLNWADGQLGALAVFSNKAKAKKYAGKDIQVFEFNVEESK